MNKYLAAFIFTLALVCMPSAHAHAAFGFGGVRAKTNCLSQGVSNNISAIKKAKSDLKKALDLASAAFGQALKTSKSSKQSRQQLRDSVALAQKNFSDAQKAAGVQLKKDLLACK